jgi:hypothetical protein
MQPTGYSTYWQYTTALALSGLAATKPATSPVVSSADIAIDSFILASSIVLVSRMSRSSDMYIDADQAPYAGDYRVILLEVSRTLRRSYLD